jgi:hypothetical protein
LGNAFAKLKRFSEAKDSARQAVKQAPDYGPAWALLGKLYSEESRYADAADAFQKAAQLMPKDADFWRSLADSYSKMNEPAKSQEAMQKSQEIAGNAPILHANPVTSAKERYTDFVMNALRASEQHDIDTIMSTYADKVVYLGHGVVDKEFIRKDLETYFKRWPVTKVELTSAVQILDTKKADEKRVLFSYDFHATAPDRGATSVGSASAEWWVWETEGILKVFGETEKVRRGQPSAQTHRDNHPVYVVVAPASRGLYIRSEANARSAIVATLHQGDRVFLEEGRVRNNHPPPPVDWQKVTSMNGHTGWINADYIAPGR